MSPGPPFGTQKLVPLYFCTFPSNVYLSGGQKKTLDAGRPESEEEQGGNVKLEEEVRRRSKENNQVKTNGFIDNRQEDRQIYLDIERHSNAA